MGKTNREKELDAVDLRIEGAEDEINDIKRQGKVADCLAELKNDPKYQLVIEQVILTEEAQRMTGYLSGDQLLSKNDVEGLNEGLSGLRSVKALLKGIELNGANTKSEIEVRKTRIKEENAYRTVVSMCNDDLTDLDEKLGA